MKHDRLKGVRVAVLVADGFEQVEATVPMRALRKAGADVRVISLRPGRIRGMNFMWRGRKLPVDDTVFDARPEDFSALLLPGGFVNPDLLRQSEKAKAFVQTMDELGRPIATLCHGPEVLVSAGLVAGRQLASWPGISDDVRNAGGTWVDEPVVRDRNWVSSRGPQDLPAFTPAMIELFAEQPEVALARLPRRVHWAAHLSRAATFAAVAGAVVGGRAAFRRAARTRVGRRITGRTRVVTAAEIVRDLGFATAFGGMLFGKVALDPAVRVLPAPEDRGKVVLDAWKRFSVPSAIGLGAATIAWLAGRASPTGRAERRPLARAADLLLAGSVLTGAVNMICAAVLTRARRGIALPMETGRSGTPELPEREARLVRAGTVSGFAHAGTLAAMIGATAALRGPAR